MFFRTPAECTQLVNQFGVHEAELDAMRQIPGPDNSVTFLFEDHLAYSYPLATQIVRLLSDEDSFLLWVVEYGIWSSNENLHLYYRLRTSYGDTRDHVDAPGHYFLPYERADLTTFLDLTMRFGWGAHLVTTSPLPSCFISHDGWLRIIKRNDVEPLVQGLEDSPFLERIT